MTELKIKQADINNNGNQRLTGAIGGGGGGAQNMYHVRLWVCACREGGGGVGVLMGFFLLLLLKYETWMDGSGIGKY